MSTRIFSIANQKGGTGKTTLAMNLAAGFARRGRTLVVDADPQGSASQWAGLAQEGRVFPASVIIVAGNLARELERFRRDYQYVVVDCPPTLETPAARMAITAADTVLIPVLPSPMDLWASVRMAKAIEEARYENRKLQAYLVLNQLETRNALSRSMHQALGEFDIPVLKNALQRRAIYRNAAMEGASVYDFVSRGKPAVAEIDAIIEEILES